MKTENNLLILAAIAAVVALTTVTSCTSCAKAEIDEDIADEGLLLNDDIVATRDEKGNITFRNTTTGVVTIKDINLDWTQPSRNDSLAVFCSRSKRGYYNMYTGEIAVPAPIPPRLDLLRRACRCTAERQHRLHRPRGQRRHRLQVSLPR